MRHHIIYYYLGMETVSGDYIAGFVDGEGCFALKFRRDIRYDRKNKPVYYYWSIEFAISLRSDDVGILETIKNTLGCGTISINNSGIARYAVTERDELIRKIVPFFDRNRLRAKKRNDYELWKEALNILERNRQKRNDSKKGFSKIEWSKKDIDRLIEIQESMREYKSNRNELKWIDKAILSEKV